ncbi:MAG: DNA polymerase III subunit beta [Desulfuromonadaceae bacterium]|nr:DNA polymerase III subunit beta [Desulfuromonadaceae bacterium]
MKIETKKHEILDILCLLQTIIERKKTLPILSNILIETITEDTIQVTATDLEIGIKAKVNATIIEEGKITIPAKKLYEIIKELPDEKIQLTKKNNNWIEINCGRSKFDLVGLSPEEYPTISEKNSIKYYEYESEKLKNIIEMTNSSISNDESKFNLCGLYIHSENDEINFVSTDGHRLTKYKDKNSESSKIFECGVIVPRKGLLEIKKLCEISDKNLSISISDNNLIVTSNKIKLFIRLIDGEFPNYKRVIPELSDNKIEIDSKLLIGTIKRISLLSNEKSKGINFKFSDNRLNVYSSNTEFGEAEEYIEIPYSNETINIGFNAKYLLDLLNHIESIAIISLNNSTSPCLIYDKNNSNYCGVIMPMRI